MKRPQKILVIGMWIVAGMAMVCVAAMKLANNWQVANSAAKVEEPKEEVDELPALYPSPAFTLTDQKGELFSRSQLIGHPWVADFIFTTCPGLCPMMSSRMAALQGELPSEVKLVSFSVDPVHDTPDALMAYSKQYHAAEGRWIFLTGTEAGIRDVVNGMKTYFKPAVASDPIVHSPYLVLVDAKGFIRRYYDTNIPGQTDEVGRDVKKLLADSESTGSGK